MCGELVPIYRFFNPLVCDHLYTDSAAERDRLSRLGYQAQGIAMQIHSRDLPADDPLRRELVELRRLHNPLTHDHLYTVDGREHHIAVTAFGFTDEGVLGLVYPPGRPLPPGAVAVERMNNVTGADHFYTTDPGEMPEKAANGWSAEGVAFIAFPPSFVAPAARPGRTTPPVYTRELLVPLYRLYNADLGNHAYTTGAAEIQQLEGLGYRLEGIAGKVVSEDLPPDHPLRRELVPLPHATLQFLDAAGQNVGTQFDLNTYTPDPMGFPRALPSITPDIPRRAQRVKVTNLKPGMRVVFVYRSNTAGGSLAESHFVALAAVGAEGVVFALDENHQESRYRFGRGLTVAGPLSTFRVVR